MVNLAIAADFGVSHHAKPPRCQELSGWSVDMMFGSTKTLIGFVAVDKIAMLRACSKPPSE